MSRKPVLLLASVAAALATAAAAVAQPASHAAAPRSTYASGCKSGFYKSASGHCVQRPKTAATAPLGATARCRDGTYSFSEHASGACSHHGGVARWIHHP